MEAAPFIGAEASFRHRAAFPNFEKVFFGFLVSGQNRGQDAETAKRLQAEHLAYMDGQAKEGKLVMASPSRPTARAAALSSTASPTKQRPAAAATATR